jgi:transcription termination factor Rho
MKIIYALSMALVLSACGGGNSTATTDDGKGGKITATENGDKSELTMTDANGQTSTVSINTDKVNFPAFAPQYPGSEVALQSTMEADGKSMLTVEQLTSDSPDKVIEFYKAALVKNNVKVTKSAVNAGIGEIIAGEGNGPTAMVNAEPQDGKTKIGLVLSNIPK